MVTTYLAPMIIMGYCYTVIGVELWAKTDALKMMSRDMFRQPAIERAVKKKRKIVKMSLIVVVLFGLCWLPYHIYFIIIFYNPGDFIGIFLIIFF